VKCETTTTTPVARPLFQDNLGEPVTEKVKTSLALNETRDGGVSEWQWYQLNHTQTICTSLQTDTTATPHHSILFTRRTLFLTPNQQCQSNDGRALKAEQKWLNKKE